ncbi:MAG TPA: hypothetical protein VGN72_21735 [Tepidisphaeraceae bacterium]|jgi:hypothetical protein|nr:hypothetical protein [Tepidisphaeraceae bacterium]
MMLRLVALLVALLPVTTRAGELLVGALQGDVRHLARNRAAGLNVSILELHWDRYQPKPGVFDAGYIAEAKQQRDAYVAAGMRVMLDLGMQYPPAWARALPHGRFVNQFGQAYDEDAKPGSAGVNAVFNQKLRDVQAAYVGRVFDDLGADFAIARLGWGYFGELGYPHPTFAGKANGYWAFDDIAQGKLPGLPPTLAACPVPGWKPGDRGDPTAAATFLKWYLAALRDYHDWQIATVRRHTAAPLAMLYPSWGIRPGQADAAVAAGLSGTTPAEVNGEIQRGFDFAACVAGVRDANVIVYTTWIDSDPAFGDDDSPDPARWSPPHFLSELAQRHPLRLGVMGENTGPGTKAALALTMSRVRRFNLSGLMWAFEPHLYSGAPDHASIDDLGRAIGQPKAPR